jgi:hypothetical protein
MIFDWCCVGSRTEDMPSPKNDPVTKPAEAEPMLGTVVVAQPKKVPDAQQAIIQTKITESGELVYEKTVPAPSKTVSYCCIEFDAEEEPTAIGSVNNTVYPSSVVGMA